MSSLQVNQTWLCLQRRKQGPPCHYRKMSVFTYGLGGRERGVLEDCTKQNQLGGWLFRGKEALALATVMGFLRCLPSRAVTYVRWMPPAKGQSSPKEEKHLLTLCRLRIFAISGFQVMSPFMNWQSFVSIPSIAAFRPGLSYSREVTEISNLSLSVARQHILPRALVALHGPSPSSCLPGPINFSIYILASDPLWDRNFKAFLEKKLPSFESTSVEAPDWSLTWTCS